MKPLGYHITFHPYGLWLPGDSRGWTDRDTALYGTPREPPSPTLRDAVRRQMSAPVFELSHPRRRAVAYAITEACAWRGWVLHALTVQTDHVHAVVTADPAPEEVMRVMKSRATRHLRESELAVPDARVWARHGSTRYIWTPSSLATRRAYVLDEHHRPIP